MLRGHDGFDYRREIVYIGQRLDAQDDIVVGILSRGRFFGGSDDCMEGTEISDSKRGLLYMGNRGTSIPWRGLNRSLPKDLDLD